MQDVSDLQALHQKSGELLNSLAAKQGSRHVDLGGNGKLPAQAVLPADKNTRRVVQAAPVQADRASAGKRPTAQRPGFDSSDDESTDEEEVISQKKIMDPRHRAILNKCSEADSVRGLLLRNFDYLEYLADSYDSYSPSGHIDFDRVVERVKEQARIVSQPPCCTHSNA